LLYLSNGNFRTVIDVFFGGLHTLVHKLSDLVYICCA